MQDVAVQPDVQVTRYLDAEQIIKQDAESHGVDPKKLFSIIDGLLKKKAAVMLRHANSVLILTGAGDKSVALHLFTVEKPMALAASVKRFISDIKQMPLKRVYGKADNQNIIRLLEASGVKTAPSDKPEFNWMAEVRS